MRPHYEFLVQQAVLEAKRLKIDRISIIEFGVASGDGLIDLCACVRKTGFNVDIIGFDTFTGLPKPTDHRDCPWLWKEGQFSPEMDIDFKLRHIIPHPSVVKGLILETLDTWSPPSPIAAIAFDLDFYSSTVDSFDVFNVEHDLIFPRVMCYFDDLHTIESVGVRAALKFFNDTIGDDRGMVIEQSHSKEVNKLDVLWRWKFYEMHDFNHPRYNDNC